MITTVPAPAAVPVLYALCALHQRQARATMRAVAAEAGLSLSCTYHHLHSLRRLGFVEWVAGQSGTLRPTVRVVAAG